jgi:hypothetical protein
MIEIGWNLGTVILLIALITAFVIIACVAMTTKDE